MTLKSQRTLEYVSFKPDTLLKWDRLGWESSSIILRRDSSMMFEVFQIVQKIQNSSLWPNIPATPTVPESVNYPPSLLWFLLYLLVCNFLWFLYSLWIWDFLNIFPSRNVRLDFKLLHVECLTQISLQYARSSFSAWLFTAASRLQSLLILLLDFTFGISFSRCCCNFVWNYLTVLATRGR